jgi:hypothetical protein
LWWIYLGIIPGRHRVATHVRRFRTFSTLTEMADENLTWIDFAGELAKVSRFGTLAASGYQRLQFERFQTFLRTIGSTSDEMSEEERLRFESYVNSKDGQNWLADFAAQAVRTRSQTAIAALAVLFADPIQEGFSDEFKADAAQALDGLSDKAIYVFLVLCALQSTLEPSGPVVRLDSEIVANTPALRELQYSLNTWVVLIDELERRGILGADFSGGMRLGSETAAWERRFRFSEESELYRRLLRRARSALGLPSIEVQLGPDGQYRLSVR